MNSMSTKYSIITWQYIPGVGLRNTAWWDNFLNERRGGMLLVDDDRINQVLGEYGAVLDSEIFTGNQHVKFANEADMTMFLLRYS